MKKIVVMSMLAASMMYATNGDNMIGVGVQSRAMGGAGVGMGMGTDSVFRNPAWIVDQKGFNASFGATAFMPDVKASSQAPAPFGTGSQSVESDADFSIIPTVSHSDHINENLSYGVGMFGVSGMGVDYRNKPGLANMRTSLQYMRFVPSISYKIDDLRLGAGLTVAYGALNMAALTPDDPTNPMTSPAHQRSGGLSEDIGFGGQIGVGYYVLPGLSVGAYYQTQVDTEYESVFDFNGDVGTPTGAYENLKLSQPAEAGIGIGYVSDCKCYSFTLDYRRIMWSDADGYDDFEWDDQDVIALGGSYNVNDALVLRAGYNYAVSPLSDKTFSTFNNAYFNTLGFPAYTESHITAGLSYQITKSTGLDIAYVYAPKVTETIAPMFAGTPNQTPELEASNEQNSVSVALRFTF